MHVDRSFIFCGFFSCFFVQNCQPAFNFSVTGFCKKYFFVVFHDQLKFSLNDFSFLGLSFVEIKSDDGYQSDGGYSLITIVPFCTT